MTTLVSSFLDGSSSFLQVTRPTLKTWMSLNFGKISSLTFLIILTYYFGVSCHCASEKSMNNVVTTLAPSFFNLIFFNIAGNNENHKILDVFEVQLDQTLDCGVSCP